ncbi:MAG: hypothetical protein JXB19_08625 [Bacteroidales bacterium]|nr:hypothetical protein [Bacteroidales bacterium]
MKLNLIRTGILIMVLLSCKSETVQEAHILPFGIYETADSYNVSDSVRAQMLRLGIQIADSMENPVIGYCEIKMNSWRDDISGLTTDDGIRIALTANTVDDEGKYHALVALKDTACISNQDIRQAVSLGDRVEIRFNMQGAAKWADMTERNIGRQVVFMIDEAVYSMPLVAGVIRSGTALITGLDREDTERIAAALNNN